MSIDDEFDLTDTAEPSVKYPEIDVQLSGRDGNAFAIIGRVRRALREGGVPREEIEAFTREAEAGDYHNLLNICMKWVNAS